MEHNPYTPPTAPVADPGERAPLERPRSVTRAVQMLWAATFLGVVFGVYAIATSPSEGIAVFGEVIGYVVVTGIVLGISYWIFTAIWNGRNWSRITLLVLAIVNVLSSLALPPVMERLGVPVPDMAVLEIVGYVIQVALTVGAIILLFSPSSRPWFLPRQ